MNFVKKLIVPTAVDIYDKNHDYIYLPAYEELCSRYGLDILDLTIGTDNDSCHDYWFRKQNLRDNSELESFHIEKGNVVFKISDGNYQADFNVRPCMRFSVDEYLRFVNEVVDSSERKKYWPYTVQEKGRTYACLNFGEAPRRDLSLNKKDPIGAALEKEYLSKYFHLDENYFMHAVEAGKLSRLAQKLFEKGLRREDDYKWYPEGQLRKTCNTYFHKSYHFGRRNFSPRAQHLLYDQEYIIKGAKFVRNGHQIWSPVRDIRWRILNWDNLPSSINPLGNGTAKTIDLFCCQAVNQMPYFIDRTKDIKEKPNLWLTSTIRGFLNGYDFLLNKDYIAAGYSAAYSENFERHNFMTECFARENEMLLFKEKENQKALNNEIVK